jgi:hypothetical protein
MRYTEIADELAANATALNDEVSSLAKLFSETAFLGDNRSFPHGLGAKPHNGITNSAWNLPRVPSPGTVRAIAWLAGVPDQVAFAAAGPLALPLRRWRGSACRCVFSILLNR